MPWKLYVCHNNKIRGAVRWSNPIAHARTSQQQQKTPVAGQDSETSTIRVFDTLAFFFGAYTTSHHITSRYMNITFHQLPSHPILSHYITHHIPSRHILFTSIPFHSIPSHQTDAKSSSQTWRSLIALPTRRVTLSWKKNRVDMHQNKTKHAGSGHAQDNRDNMHKSCKITSDKDFSRRGAGQSAHAMRAKTAPGRLNRTPPSFARRRTALRTPRLQISGTRVS